MATKVVTLENPDNKKVKTVKVGFSLGFLLFGPLWFLLKGMLWRTILWMVIFVIVGMILSEIISSVGADDFYVLGMFVVNIYLSRTGNKKVGKYWIKKGFVFLEPASDAAHLAKSKWGVEIPVREKTSEETEEQRQKEEKKTNTVQVYKQGGISDWCGDLSLDETNRTISLKPAFLQPTGKFSYKITDVKELTPGSTLFDSLGFMPKNCHKLIFNDHKKFLFIFDTKKEGGNFLEKCANVGLSLPQKQKIYVQDGGGILGWLKIFYPG